MRNHSLFLHSRLILKPIEYDSIIIPNHQVMHLNMINILKGTKPNVILEPQQLENHLNLHHSITHDLLHLKCILPFPSLLSLNVQPFSLFTPAPFYLLAVFLFSHISRQLLQQPERG